MEIGRRKVFVLKAPCCISAFPHGMMLVWQGRPLLGQTAPQIFFGLPEDIDVKQIRIKILEVNRCAVRCEAAAVPAGRTHRDSCQTAGATREKAKHGPLI